jgi:hypothetical protein
MFLTLVFMLRRDLQSNTATKNAINMSAVTRLASRVSFAMAARALAVRAEPARLLFIVGWFRAAAAGAGKVGAGRAGDCCAPAGGGGGARGAARSRPPRLRPYRFSRWAQARSCHRTVGG